MTPDQLVSRVAVLLGEAGASVQDASEEEREEMAAAFVHVVQTTYSTSEANGILQPFQRRMAGAQILGILRKLGHD
jgi:hypothetical protein